MHSIIGNLDPGLFTKICPNLHFWAPLNKARSFGASPTSINLAPARSLTKKANHIHVRQVYNWSLHAFEYGAENKTNAIPQVPRIRMEPNRPSHTHTWLLHSSFGRSTSWRFHEFQASPRSRLVLEFVLRQSAHYFADLPMQLFVRVQVSFFFSGVVMS